MKARRVAGPSEATQARELRMEQVRATVRRALVASEATEPNKIDVDHIAAAFGAEVAFDDLEGAAARPFRSAAARRSWCPHESPRSARSDSGSRT